MTNWKEVYDNLPSEELDKIAILRVMECTNGVIQHAYRDKQIYAYPVYTTRKAMQFSMSCMKNMEIPLKSETITFAPETEELLQKARYLYVSGVKKGSEEDFAEFMQISAATAQACGKERILKAKEILSENVDAIPAQAYDWGVNYLMQFL